MWDGVEYSSCDNILTCLRTLLSIAIPILHDSDFYETILALILFAATVDKIYAAILSEATIVPRAFYVDILYL